jgi:hypothetical protein
MRRSVLNRSVLGRVAGKPDVSFDASGVSCYPQEVPGEIRSYLVILNFLVEARVACPAPRDFGVSKVRYAIHFHRNLIDSWASSESMSLLSRLGRKRQFYKLAGHLAPAPQHLLPAYHAGGFQPCRGLAHRIYVSVCSPAALA